MLSCWSNSWWCGASPSQHSFHSRFWSLWLRYVSWIVGHLRGCDLSKRVWNWGSRSRPWISSSICPLFLHCRHRNKMWTSERCCAVWEGGRALIFRHLLPRRLKSEAVRAHLSGKLYYQGGGFIWQWYRTLYKMTWSILPHLNHLVVARKPALAKKTYSYQI